MMPGPASSMVTLLPRNRPTPIAPPMAIIVSWREFSRRCSSPNSRGGVAVLTSRCDTKPPEYLSKQHLTLCDPLVQFRLIACDTAQHIDKLADLLDGVVVDERCPNGSSFWRNPHATEETWRVHIPISHSDSVFRTDSGHSGGMYSVQIETNCGHTVLELARLSDSVHGNVIKFLQVPQSLGGQCCFVDANRFQGGD